MELFGLRLYILYQLRLYILSWGAVPLMEQKFILEEQKTHYFLLQKHKYTYSI